MFADYTVHVGCDIILTYKILSMHDGLWNPSMEPRENKILCMSGVPPSLVDRGQ